MMAKSLMERRWNDNMLVTKHCEKCGCLLGKVHKSKRFCEDCNYKRNLATQATYRQTEAYRRSLVKYRLSEKHKSVSKIYFQREDVKERIREQSRERKKGKYTFKLCKQCGNAEIVYPDRHLYCELCNSQRQLARQNKYHKTDKWKDCLSRYINSVKGKATRVAYDKSDAGRAAAARYRNSEKGRAAAQKRKQKGIVQEIVTNITLERAV
jgi:uncharacterized OB-fold protein